MELRHRRAGRRAAVLAVLCIAALGNAFVGDALANHAPPAPDVNQIK